MDEIVRADGQAMAEAGTPFSRRALCRADADRRGPKLIEYNVRFGDPECEAIMPRIEGDLPSCCMPALGAPFLRRACLAATRMTVIVAAKGYPGARPRAAAIRASRRPSRSRASPSSTPAPPWRRPAGRQRRPGAGGHGRRPMLGEARRAPIARSTRSTSPTASAAATSAGASWSAAVNRLTILLPEPGVAPSPGFAGYGTGRSAPAAGFPRSDGEACRAGRLDQVRNDPRSRRICSDGPLAARADPQRPGRRLPARGSFPQRMDRIMRGRRACRTFAGTRLRCRRSPGAPMIPC